jgi:hypothetical protein
MSTVEAQAKQARALLAAALSQLQGEGAAAELRPSAELVARSMGLLLQMERQPGRASRATGDQVRSLVRDALSTLQVTSQSQPKALQAMKSVASALGVVHDLHNDGARPAVSSRGARPALGVKTLSLLSPAAKADPTEKQPPQAEPKDEPQQALPPLPVQAAEPAAAARNAWPTTQRRRPSAPRNSTRPRLDGPFSVEASLGAHSSSNFYKGLGRGDVLEAGGIFVATHRIPPIGKPVTLHVHLPGGYEFQAYGVVTWTRETSTTLSEGLDAPPGFGARFTEISPHGRELVNRYAANREPLFHDS